MAPAPADRSPYVFISYSRADQAYVTKLVAYPTEGEINVWLDAEIDDGDSWPTVLRDRVDGCAALVVVMTPASEDSKWVRNGITCAEQRDETVLPILLDGLPSFELNRTQYEDVSDGRMPTPGFVGRLSHLTSTGRPLEPNDAAVPTNAVRHSRPATIDGEQGLRRVSSRANGTHAHLRAPGTEPTRSPLLGSRSPPSASVANPCGSLRPR